MLRADHLALLDVQTHEEFRSRLIRFTRSSGLETMSAMTVTDRKDGQSDFVSVDNVPDGYRESFENFEDGKRDPVMQHCKRSGIPLHWSRCTYVRAGQDDLWEKQAQFGLVTGIALAIHLPQGKHFFMGMERDKELPRHPVEITRMIADFALFATCAQEAAVRVLLPPQREVDLPKLTERELECLRWTMEGKTAWELGRILGISENTAVRHAFNASRKLGCVSKHQAVVKALRLGLIR